jgi:hypothetical protein
MCDKEESLTFVLLTTSPTNAVSPIRALVIAGVYTVHSPNRVGFQQLYSGPPLAQMPSFRSYPTILLCVIFTSLGIFTHSDVEDPRTSTVPSAITPDTCLCHSLLQIPVFLFLLPHPHALFYNPHRQSSWSHPHSLHIGLVAPLCLSLPSLLII